MTNEFLFYLNLLFTLPEYDMNWRTGDSLKQRIKKKKKKIWRADKIYNITTL